MRSDIRQLFDREMAQARCAAVPAERMAHLERAHILGQRWFWPHLITHCYMFGHGWQQRDAREVIGQIVRLAAVMPGWLSGWVPKGNSGGANVSAIRPMAPPEDLRPLLAEYNVWRDIAIRLPLWGILALGLALWLSR